MHLHSTMTMLGLMMEWLMRNAIEYILETIENVNKLVILFDLSMFLSGLVMT